MKRIILSGWFIFLVTVLYGQITLQKTYDYSASVVKLETLGYKYYLMDVPNSQCRIYNMDHSIFKTINCDVPNGYYLSDIKYISENLFNTDSKIELAYTYYKYIETTTSYYYIYGSRITNESGTTILSIDNAQYIYVNQTDVNEFKLFAYCLDYSVFPESVWTNIYSLPGSLVSAIDFSDNKPNLSLNAYPNPTNKSVRVEYKLPADVKNASLYLIDSNGREVRNFLVDGHSNFLALNVDNLSKGVYFYFIEYESLRSESKKIIVQ
ncbi:MAG: T9SS type A sorting domain-containing protein [Bacteroidales bacterium]|nr:T9SS type A sorting domain-containing protein [Bacteroidales bacterium]